MNDPIPPKMRVVIADSHRSCGELVSLLLDRDGRCASLGEALTGGEALRLVTRFKPDLLITELTLPEMSAPELIRRLRDQGSAARVLIYTGNRNLDLIAAACKERPNGFALKTDSLQVLRQIILATLEGGIAFSPEAQQLIETAAETLNSSPSLAPRERAVLQLVAEGRTSKQIADRLGISKKTVDFHRGNLMRKLDVHDVASLTRQATHRGLLTGESPVESNA